VKNPAKKSGMVGRDFCTLYREPEKQAVLNTARGSQFGNNTGDVSPMWLKR
jgi:hypothetical protein